MSNNESKKLSRCNSKGTLQWIHLELILFVTAQTLFECPEDGYLFFIFYILL